MEQATPMDTPAAQGPMQRDQSGFPFLVDTFKPRFSDARILDSLRAFAATVGGRAFRPDEFEAWTGRLCGAQTVSRRFKGWWRALQRAGIEGTHPSIFDPETLMLNLRAIWLKKGGPPTILELKRYGSISVSPYVRRWGSMRNACLRLARFERGDIPLAELLRNDGQTANE